MIQHFPWVTQPQGRGEALIVVGVFVGPGISCSPTQTPTCVSIFFFFSVSLGTDRPAGGFTFGSQWDASLASLPCSPLSHAWLNTHLTAQGQAALHPSENAEFSISKNYRKWIFVSRRLWRKTIAPHRVLKRCSYVFCSNITLV